MNYRMTALVLALTTGQALAAEEEGPWQGKVSFGYLATSGNSENTSANAATEISYSSGNWKHLLDAQALGAQDDVDTTAEAYQLGLKTDFSLSEFNYIFATARWQKDKFSGYDQQTTEAIGYGRRLINGERHVLNAEIGAGAKQAELRDGASQNETILLGALDYTWTITETAEFSQDVRLESGEDNTYVESVSALSAKLLGDLALVVSYTVQNNSDVPPDSERTDTFTAISLEYSF